MASDSRGSLIQKHLKTMVQAFPDTYFVLDSEGTLLDYRAGIKEIFTAASDNVCGCKIRQIFSKEIGWRIEAALTRVIETSVPSSMEYSLNIRGEERFFEARLLPLPDRQAMVCIREITGLKVVSGLTRLNDTLQKEVAEKQRTEDEFQKRTKLLATLLEVSNLVTSTLDLKPLLEAILDRLKNIIDYKGAKIFVIEGETLKVLAHRSRLTDKDISEYMFDITSVPMGHEIIAEKRPMLISDVLSSDPAAVEFKKTMERYISGIFNYMRSWIGLPLIVKDRVVGVLTMDHDRPGFYLPQHIELGMAIANQVAIEFENARLYNETVQRADELRTMISVQQAVTSRLDRDSVLKLIADEGRRLTNSERTAVFLVEGNDLVLSVMSGKAIADMLGYRMNMDKTFAGRFLLAGKALMHNNASEDPELYAGILEKAKVKSFVSIPLMSGSKPIGTITVADKLTGDYNRDDERILSMLGSIAVIALENSRMYQEEHRRHLEDQNRRRVAEGLRDTLAILNSNRPLQDILQFIIKQGTSMMGTTTGALYRLQKEKNILTIEAFSGLPEEYVSKMVIPVGQGVVGVAVENRKPMAVPNMVGYIPRDFLEDVERGPHLRWLTEHYHGLLAVPLLCKDEIYGGIVLYYPDIKEFTREEIDLAMTFADQAALAIDNARLRAQAEEIAVATERSRLARDLHDAVTQTLFSASLIAEVLPKIWERKPEEGKKRLEELRQLTKGALAEMRTLLLELRPATLMETGLKELMNQLVLAATGRTRIPIDLRIEGIPVLPPDIKISLYRIAQEALNNIAKHSGATQVGIDLIAAEGENGRTRCAELRIRDNGRGFESCRIKPDSLGLGIMKERAESMSADLQIKSRVGEGTEVLVKWSARKEGEYYE